MRARSTIRLFLAALAPLLMSRALAAPPVTWKVDAGTTGVLVEDHRVPTVHVQVEWPAGTWSPWVRANDADDAFVIQLHDPAGTLRRRADLLAAEVGLSMGERAAVLQLSCLADDLDAALDLVRDILANRSFDRAELKRLGQRSRVMWNASEKDPHFRSGQKVAQLFFRDGDPRRLPWDGPLEYSTDTAALVLVRDQLVRIPGRVVAFAGDLTEAEAHRAAAALLPEPAAGAPLGLAPDLQPLADPALLPREATVPLARLTQVYFSYDRDSLPWDHPDYPAFVIADHVLGGHFYSRLYLALRHEGGETYGARSESDGDVVPGPYGLETFTRTANAAHAEGRLREVLRLFHERGITEDERRDAVSYWRGRLPFSRQAPRQVLSRWLTERRLGLAPGSLDALPERAAALSLAEVNAFIARWYDPGRFTLVRVAPD